MPSQTNNQNPTREKTNKSNHMEDFLIVTTIIAAIISIIVLIKFFQIAKDLNYIKQKIDRETYSKNEVSFLIANGYKDEAKRMLLRKVWEVKDKYPYNKIKSSFSKYFAQIGEPFPDEAIFKNKEKVSNPV